MQLRWRDSDEIHQADTTTRRRPTSLAPSRVLPPNRLTMSSGELRVNYAPLHNRPRTASGENFTSRSPSVKPLSALSPSIRSLNDVPEMQNLSLAEPAAVAPVAAPAVAPTPAPPATERFAQKSSSEKQEEMSVWSGFFKKTLRERQDQIQLIYPHLDLSPLEQGGLPGSVADVMVENCIGVAALPLGVAPNFVVNGQAFVVPMCVEEPSVIAAASGIAKLLASNGGFTAQSTPNVMTGEVQLCDFDSREAMQAAVDAVNRAREELIAAGNEHCDTMKKRGGGVTNVHAHIVEPRRPRPHQPFGFVIVHIDINVCEAMGANIVNTVAEGIAPTLEQITGARVGLKILTNLCLQRITRVQFKIPVEQLKWKGVDGRVVAERIIEAYNFADDDPFRAATHNKGVMNGIDAVAIALGQDWRAIEASAHAYVQQRLGYYGPVTAYAIVDEPSTPASEAARGALPPMITLPPKNGDSAPGTYLVGCIEMPFAVGTKGGALQTHPMYRLTHAVLGNPDAATLAQIMCAVGLAQNFAAIRALAIEGIQRGHMGLHARNIAIAAGVPNGMVAEVAAYMVVRKKVNASAAKEYMDAHSLFCSASGISPQKPIQPSTIYVELPTRPSIKVSLSHASLSSISMSAGASLSNLSSLGALSSATSPAGIAPEPLTLNVAFATLGSKPVHLVLDMVHAPHPLQQSLLGVNKSMQWLSRVYDILDRIKLTTSAVPRANRLQQNKLKLISILLNLVVHRLLVARTQETSMFLHFLAAAMRMSASTLGLQRANEDFTAEAEAERAAAMLDQVPADDPLLLVGFPLILALWRVFYFSVEQWVLATNPLLARALLTQQCTIIESMVARQSSYHELLGTNDNKNNSFDRVLDFMRVHAPRWQATMFLLCDCIAIAPALLTPERLAFVHQIGEYFEFEGALAHDINRLSSSADEPQREAPSGGPNVYRLWLESEGVAHSSATLTRFLALVAAESDRRRARILEVRADADFFDANHFLQTIKVVRQEYDLNLQTDEQ